MTATANLELNEITKIRLEEINKIKDYFNNEIKERKHTINKINKYTTASDYADTVFIMLSASFGTVSIGSFVTIIDVPVGITSGVLSLVFTISTGIVKKVLSVTRKTKKKHNKIMVFANNGLNMIETLLSSALSGCDISHEEFEKNINEKIKYEGMKKNVKNLMIGQANESTKLRETQI